MANAQDAENKFSVPVKNWNVQFIGLNNFYPTYLADPLGIRFEVSSQSIKYSDFDFFDDVNNGGTYHGKLTIYSGVQPAQLVK